MLSTLWAKTAKASGALTKIHPVEYVPDLAGVLAFFAFLAGAVLGAIFASPIRTLLHW